MIVGKTTNGYEYCIPKRRLNNMRLIDAIAEMETNALAVSRVVVLLLGQDGRDKLYAHLEDDEGIVDTGAVETAVTEIMEAYGKNC